MFSKFAPQVRVWADQGFITGASGRNWTGYGHEVSLPNDFAAPDQALLTDPQTSGGLLVSCAPECTNEVLSLLRTAGFSQASAIGQVQAGAGLSIGA